jgi:hypothetical protein
MTMNDSRQPKPDEPESSENWRRFVSRATPWQFSLRALLLFVLVASIGLSLLGTTIQRDQRDRQAMVKQREAVAELEKAGARIGADNDGWVRSVALRFRLG